MRSLILSLLFISTAAFGDPIELGNRYISEGNKKAAWKILYPLAQQGNPDACFSLGVVMIGSEEVKDNYRKAIFFLRCSQRGGNPYASAYLNAILNRKKNIAEYVEKATQNALFAGLIHKETTSLAQAKREEMQALDETPKIGDGQTIAELNVYLSESNSQTTKLIRQVLGLKNKWGNRLHVRAIIICDQGFKSDFDSNTQPILAHVKDVQPDVNGAMAQSYGVKAYPALTLKSAENEHMPIRIYDVHKELVHIARRQ